MDDTPDFFNVTFDDVYVFELFGMASVGYSVFLLCVAFCWWTTQ